MGKSFIWINKKKQHINELSIGYMINPNLNINKSFRQQLDKYMNNTFGPITLPHIRAKLSKKKTRVLALLMSYETRKNDGKYFKVLNCVIYKIINNYVCIGYLSCE